MALAISRADVVVCEGVEAGARGADVAGTGA